MSPATHLYHSIISIQPPCSNLILRNLSYRTSYAETLSSNASLAPKDPNNLCLKEYHFQGRNSSQNCIVLRHEIPCRMELEFDDVDLRGTRVQISYDFRQIAGGPPRRSQRFRILRNNQDRQAKNHKMKISEFVGNEIPTLEIHISKESDIESEDRFLMSGEAIAIAEQEEQTRNKRNRSTTSTTRRKSLKGNSRLSNSLHTHNDTFDERNSITTHTAASLHSSRRRRDPNRSSSSRKSDRVSFEQEESRLLQESHQERQSSRLSNTFHHLSRLIHDSHEEDVYSHDTENQWNYKSHNTSSFSENYKPMIVYTFDPKLQNNKLVRDKVLRHLKMTCHRFCLKSLSEFMKEQEEMKKFCSKKLSVSSWLKEYSLHSVDSMIEHLVVIYSETERSEPSKLLDTLALSTSHLYEVVLKDQASPQSTISPEKHQKSLQEEFSSLTGVTINQRMRFKLILFNGKILACQENKRSFAKLEKQLRYDACVGE